MVWEGMKFDDPEVKFDPQIFTAFQRAIAMRSQLPELRLGFFRGVVIDDDRGVYAFARELGDDVAIVVINRSGSERQVTVPAEGLDAKKLIDWLDSNHARLVMGDGTRPQLVAKPDAAFVPVTGGKFVITLRPFSTAVLTKQ